MARDADAALAEWASRHHGLYRASDALRFGLTRRQVGDRVTQGRSERLGGDVYRLAGSPKSPQQRLLSAAWRSGGPGSHLSSASVLGLIDREVHRPHVTVDSSAAHDLTDSVVHRSDDLRPSDIITIRGMPITNAARTLVDIGCMVRRSDLEKALHRALHRKLTTVEDLSALYRRISRRGRTGAGPIGELLQLYDGTMAAESDLEVEILRLLEDHGVRPPQRQVVVNVEGQGFRLDLAYPDHKVFLEGDGFGVHGGRSAFEDDRWRQNLLVLNGWWPLRFTWRQATTRRAACADLVATKLAEIEVRSN